MKLPTGTTSICRHEGCGEEIYYSQVRDPGDPWVHRNWTKHAHTPEETGAPIRVLDGTTLRKLPPYDHCAEPTLATYEYVVTIESVVTDRTEEIRNMVSQALNDCERFTTVSVLKRQEIGI